MSRWPSLPARSLSAPRLALLGALLLTAGPLRAAPEPPRPADTYTEKKSTVLVEVPVEVTREGQPVRDLSAANFELFDNGRRQEIEGVEMVDLEALGAQPLDLPVAARRHFLLLFDHGFTTPTSFEKARLAAFDFVQNDLTPSDLVAVATFSTRDGVKVPLSFTPDRSQALLTLQNLGAGKAGDLKPDPLRLYVGNKSQLRDPGEDEATGIKSGGADAVREQALEMARTQLRGSETEGRRDVKILSESLQRLAAMLRQVSGRKHVIFFSEGFDSSLLLGGQNEQEVEQNYQAAAKGEIWNIDSDSVFGNRTTLTALDQLTEALRRSDCTLHSVDVAGLRAGGEAAGGAGKRGKDGLFLMARDTGGELFENFNDLGAAMQKLLTKTSVTYLLSYQPQELDFDGKYRKLKVKLKGAPDARLVHRPGYFAPDAKKGQDDFGTLLATGQQLLDRRKGELDTRILPLPLQQDLAGRRYVPTLVEVRGDSFFPPPVPGREAPKKVRADVFLYAFDHEGGIADFFSQAISFDLSEAGTAFGANGFRLFAPLLLAPGDYTVRALVRDPGSGRSGAARAFATVLPEPVTSGGEPAKAIALLPPLLPQAMDQWVLVRGQRKDLAGQSEPDYPFSFTSRLYSPVAEPELRSGERLPFLIAGWGLEDLRLDAKLLDARGAEAAPVALTFTGKATVTPAGMIQQLVGFTVPSLPTGDYLLAIEGVHSARGLVATGRLPVHLEGGAPVDRALAFAAPEGDGRDAERLAARRAAPAEDAAAVEKSVAGLRGLYRQALAGLRPGESSKSALDRLEAFEVAALGEQPESKVARLSRAELEVVKRLAASDLESLLPLLEAHQELYLRHKAERRPYLEIHSRQMVVALAELYAERGDSDGSKMVASRALSSLGGYLLADGRTAALDLLEKATALDARNEAAYLGLAAYYEKRGGPYEAAVAALERLAAKRPESREGRLRLAVNLLRVAKTDNLGGKAKARRAELLFRELLEAPDDDWISSLAAQELARFEFGERRHLEAVGLLEKALQRRPDDQELLVQLAFFYDRLEQGAVPRLLDRVSRQGGHDEAPRGRYNQWQSEAMARDRSALKDGARQRLPLLDQALVRLETQESR